jgi:hypothetical protein
MAATSARTVLGCVLRVMQPLARLLIKSGVSYPAFAQALKTVFLGAAREELESRAMPLTDSAVSLLSGVHRRDVRTLTRPADGLAAPQEHPSLVSQVMARWMNEPEFSNGQGGARVLPRAGAADSFEQLVARVSSDVRPRAVLDELQRLGAVVEDAQGVRLLDDVFVPRKGLDEMARLFADNLADHLAAASRNLLGEQQFLEQAVFVDELTAASVERLNKVARLAWQQAFKLVMQEAQVRFDDDALNAGPAARTHRARFGVYFFSESEVEK